jgi:hypothetical protein
MQKCIVRKEPHSPLTREYERLVLSREKSIEESLLIRDFLTVHVTWGVERDKVARTVGPNESV